MSDFEIVARADFSEVTYLLEIRHPLMAKAARPGQLGIVMEHEHGERIPLTIADFDRDKGTITLVIQAVGKTTREMQQRSRVGTKLHAMVGPMGIPSHIGQARKVVCVDGPDFDGYQVDFDDLMARLGCYKPTEKAALEAFNQSCRSPGARRRDPPRAARGRRLPVADEPARTAG